MRREIKLKTGQLLDSSDLTVAAPIRRGLVPSLDAVSYKTRTERVLQLLQLGRHGQHEFELTRVLADAADRIGLIHAVRVAIIEPQNLVMLSVTFDGAWEPYMRVIWQKVARLLDLIFCNTEAYVFGWESSYEDWMVWLRRHQVSTPFLYAQPHLTVGDGDLLGRQEWLQRQRASQEEEARLLQVSNADAVEEVLSSGDASDPRFPGSKGYRESFGGDFLIVRQSIRALAGLHRLTDVYLPGTHDGWVLHRAAREALPRLAFLHSTNSIHGTDAVKRFADALKWLDNAEPDLPVARRPPPLQNALSDVLPEALWPQIQAGILEPLEADHGAVLLLRFDSAVALGEFLQSLPLTHHAQPFNDEGVSVNVALSVEGLRLAGFTDDELRTWPDAFHEGMSRRAGLLGDVRLNHPRNWRLPLRLPDSTLTRQAASDGPGAARVDLAEMHALLHVRLRRGMAAKASGASKILGGFLARYTLPEQRLAIQWLHRQRNDAGQTVEHFGWRDAQTSPMFDKAKSSPEAFDHSHLGEALCGHANAVDHRWPAASQPCASWLHNGSFLVVRKLGQDVAALNDAVAKVDPPLDGDLVRAKLMGRWPDEAPHGMAGLPLLPDDDPADPPDSNNFSFVEDRDGAVCPLHAHIRRGNPRMPPGSLTNYPPELRPQAPVRPPKLLRRGMSYGPKFAEGQENAERGLFFMAYNASLADQFEVVQRWLSGGNSAGGDSAQADPLVGVTTPGRDRTSLFHHKGTLHRVVLEPATYLNEEPRPLVRLEWGAYWFAPSLPIVARMAGRALSAREAPLWDAHRGEEDIDRLLAVERREGPEAALLAWKEALEDPESLLDYRAASIWAAIRELHGGHLKCAFGVLVGDPEGVDRVLRDEQRYTAAGYLPRMQYSFGPIFLGSDAGAGDGRYERESAYIVDAIRQLPFEDTYKLARAVTHDRLRHLRDVTKEAAEEARDLQWRLAFEVRELLDPLLERFCKTWFGILIGDQFDSGGLDASLDAHAKPRSPGHFASPSRYFFQPHPNADVARVGQAHGQALRRAMQALLDAKDPDTLDAPLVKAVLANPLSASDPGYAARTLVGVVMGFVPTVEGTLRRILAEWLREGSFWRLRGLGPSLPDCAAAYRFMKADFVRGIQMRAAPELLWRTAAIDHTLGEGADAVSVRTGDRVVAGLMSATHCRWQQGSHDYFYVFGGDRNAAESPTHACPGTRAAVALMLGFFAALLESDLPLRPGPGLSFEASGETETAIAEPHAAVSFVQKALLSFTTRVKTMALGDSWLVTPSALGQSLTRSLSLLGYKITSNLSSKSFTLTAIADRAVQAVQELPSVQMVLLDGGGNDVHQVPSFFQSPQNPDWGDLPNKRDRSTLDDLLMGKNGNVAVNGASVRLFIHDHLKKEMRRALTPLTSAGNRRPVIITAYDFPIPNGTGLRWLAPAFERLGLDMRKPADLAKGAAMMKTLISELNDMIANLVQTEFKDKDVHAIRLTGTLSAEEWQDELHPTGPGFDKLAKKLDAEIRKLPAPVPKPVP